MKNLLKFIAGLFMGTGQAINLNIPSDSTIYLVETIARKYCGRIIYQDDVVIKLKMAKPKVVKILKSNIEQITVVRSEVADQYFQWHHARLQM